MSENKRNDEQENSIQRRRVLRSAALGSGALLGAKALPEEWSKPVLESVVLPAHAQTSGEPDEPDEPEVITGVYTATGLQGPAIAFNFLDQLKNSPQVALLDAFIPNAHATANDNSGALDNICGNPSDSPPVQPSSAFTLTLRINQGGSVDIAVDGEFFTQGGNDSINPIICAGTSTLSETTIADTLVNVGRLGDAFDCFISLSNMTASATQVTGTWGVDIGSNQDSSLPSSCGGSFTAPLTGTFPTAVACQGQQVQDNDITKE